MQPDNESGLTANGRAEKDKPASAGWASPESPLNYTDWILSIGVLIVIAAGVAMRLIALGDHPYGLYQDEAHYGLDALDVLAGERPLYFPANNGREPLFIYLVAVTVSLFGRTPLGIRAASATLGLLTIPATYLLGRTWGGRRVGLLCSGILSVTLWHVHLSRVGFRVVSLPLPLALTLALGALALKRRSRELAAAAGVAYGLSFYTYLAARFTPLALIGMLTYGLAWHRGWLRERRTLLAWMAVPSVLLLLPLAWLAVTQPSIVLGRSAQVAIWNGADFTATLIRNALHVLGMFTWRGDTIWRHNVPGRPVFDPLLGVMFVVGVLLAVARWRQRPALALAVIWVGAMLMPTLLAEDAPHFLRAVGVLPVVMLIPAIAADAGLAWLENRRLKTSAAGILGSARMLQCSRRRLASLTSVVVLAISAGLTARDYFGCRNPVPIRLSGSDYTGCYRTDPVRGYFFQAEATTLAHEINASEGTVILDRRFWETFPSVRFLVVRNRLTFYDEGAEPMQPVPAPMTLIAWPHAGLESALLSLPPSVEIEVAPGPETRGDLEQEPYRLYARYTARPLPSGGVELASQLGRFDNGVVLVDLTATPTDEAVEITLRWYAEHPLEQPVQVFLHIVDEGGAILAQIDEPPGTAFYPPLSWQPGSVIIQRASLAADVLDHPNLWLRIGLYDPATVSRVPILHSRAGHEDDEALMLPIVSDSAP